MTSVNDEKINITVRIITQRDSLFMAKMTSLRLKNRNQLDAIFVLLLPTKCMNRKDFLSLIGLSSLPFLNKNVMATAEAQPQTFYFKDDGKIPNNKLPLLLYRNAFAKAPTASKLKTLFASNNWTNAWDNGVYSFHHYHSTSHEVLGIYAGSAMLHLGGEEGEKIKVQAGDVIIIPAGVGHKNISASEDFGVVGAYPDGRDWDLLKGEPGERPKADKNIAALPIPDTDPLLGKMDGVKKIWSKEK